MRQLLFIICVLSAFSGYCQQPVVWQLKLTKQNDSILIATCEMQINAGWHMYMSDDPELGVMTPNLSADSGITVSSPVLEGTNYLISDPIFEARKMAIAKGKILLSQRLISTAAFPGVVRITLHAACGSKDAFQMVEESKDVMVSGQPLLEEASLRVPTIDVRQPLAECPGVSKQGKSIFSIFLLGFGGGLLALLTPCVFPMVPVTVSFFTSKSVNRKQGIFNAVLYGGFIFLIYVGCSVPFHLVAGVDPALLNSISTNAWLNLLFFVIFILFALSFFGLFEIGLPVGIMNRMNNKGSLGSLAGIFFMALSLTIVSFSCTGVVLGSLLVGAASTGAWPLTAGMAGFGIALGLPFGLFAFSPRLLKSLPKSGGWLGVVKKTLAFVELALALKFLSNADLVGHWGLLKREVFILIWLLIALALAIFLLRPLFLARQTLFSPRLLFGLAALLFAGWLGKGLIHKSQDGLNVLSGFLPPKDYSLSKENRPSGDGLLPDVINDYAAAILLAKKQGKPLLIDFTGWACVNCRKMEENVWTDPAVRNYIRENYVLLSLYVDDRKALPVEQQRNFRSTDGNVRLLRTYGDKWAGFQVENFRVASQPLYALISPDEQLLNSPVGYTPDANNYRSWLECGYQNFYLTTTHRSLKP